jgi:lipopolysaccharide export system protein LptC
VVSAGPLGTITSGSLHVAPAAEGENARRFSFGNGVKLIYDPPDEERGTP